MPEAKSKIHSYIQHIREEIERNVDLDQDKKDKLLSALNKFAGEVDRTRTREQLPAGRRHRPMKIWGKKCDPERVNF